MSYFLGRCSNGTESVGCGPQEEFRACSDVSITTADGYSDATINELGKKKYALKTMTSSLEILAFLGKFFASAKKNIEWARKLKKNRTKKLAKSNKSIS